MVVEHPQTGEDGKDADDEAGRDEDVGSGDDGGAGASIEQPYADQRCCEHGDETNTTERVLYERRLARRRAEDGDQHRTNEHERRQDKPNYARVAD